MNSYLYKINYDRIFNKTMDQFQHVCEAPIDAKGIMANVFADPKPKEEAEKKSKDLASKIKRLLEERRSPGVKIDVAGSDDEKYDKKDKSNLNADIRAKARGCIVVEPKDNELFVDIDREEDMTVFRTNLGWLEGLVVGYDVKPSTSGKAGRYHIVVRLSRPVRDVYERIGLQAILGSDRLREVLSWRNAVHNSGRPTVFFEKKPEEIKSGTSLN